MIGVDPSIQASFAEYITVPARNVVRLADSLRPDLGALVEPLAGGTLDASKVLVCPEGAKTP